jgi:uncharacterized protein YecE (DUF72 family)
MDFGKLSSLDGVNFSLPPDKSETIALLRGLPTRSHSGVVYVGCTGWAMKEWIGTVYPLGVKTNDFLTHYGKQFNTIELNTTHYRTPSRSTIDDWRGGVPDDFKFCPKMLQAISHSKNLGHSAGLIQPFFDSILGLEQKLGTCFMQLPPYFGFEGLAVLEAFLKRFAKLVPLSIEIRQETWFSNALYSDTFFDLLEYYEVGSVITDVSGRRDVLHQRLTTGKAVIRFVGNGLDPTDYTRIDEWVGRLKTWFDEGLHEAYLFTHEPDNLLSPQLAKYAVDKIQKTLKGIEVRGPRFIQNEGRQLGLFD